MTTLAMYRLYIFMLLIATLALVACGRQKTTDTAVPAGSMPPPPFETDSAMAFLKAQTDMGPRVPGSEAHMKCGDYLAGTLRRLGADTVTEHRAEVTAWNGDRLHLRNIMGRFNRQSGVRPVLLVAHWDSRPWADAEEDTEHAGKPIDGANDGASGVAVLLEIARQASIHGTMMPLDILLVDGEDYGNSDSHDGDMSWCLGTQEWLKEESPYNNEPTPRYGILLDMVGGRDARFHREYFSDRYAPGIVDMVWNTAASIGLSDRFVNEPGGAVTDDHLFLNRAGIPVIDIIENKNPATGSFNTTWHTHEDNYDNIDPTTIRDTGQVISKLTVSMQ
ncbi:MAG: M28 family peptidase [Muribaculaceae bacterium]|nr:M28 family peptidase [Muribaculaceae bacterium]